MIAILVTAALAATPKAVVLVDDVGACEVITAERVKLADWPTTLGAPPVVDPAAVVGKVAVEPMFTGEAVRPARLAADAAAAGCGAKGAARVGVPVKSAVYERGMAASWWAPRLGCAVFGGAVVDGVDAVPSIGLATAPSKDAMAAFARLRTTPVVTPRGSAPLPVCQFHGELPAGPWHVSTRPGVAGHGGLGDQDWVQRGVLDVPVGVGGLGGVVAVGSDAWTVGADEAKNAEPLTMEPITAAVFANSTIFAASADPSIVEVVVTADGSAVAISRAGGSTKILAVTPDGPRVRRVTVVGPPGQIKPLQDGWRNLSEGVEPVAHALSGGPFEVQLEHGWVQVRALAPGKGIVVYLNRAGQMRAALVER